MVILLHRGNRNLDFTNSLRLKGIELIKVLQHLPGEGNTNS